MFFFSSSSIWTCFYNFSLFSTNSKLLEYTHKQDFRKTVRESNACTQLTLIYEYHSGSAPKVHTQTTLSFNRIKCFFPGISTIIKGCVRGLADMIGSCCRQLYYCLYNCCLQLPGYFLGHIFGGSLDINEMYMVLLMWVIRYTLPYKSISC